jgi:peptide-methionine (R)-S-oxide reductase
MAKFDIDKSDAEWRKDLSSDQYDVLRRHGTEPPGSSILDKQYNPGTYKCAGCGTPLFSSEHKFDSRSGWPSYFQPLDGAVDTKTDFKLFMPRTEVHCAKCGGHLGHVFDDGPAPTGKRYCINGVSLKFDKE